MSNSPLTRRAMMLGAAATAGGLAACAETDIQNSLQLLSQGLAQTGGPLTSQEAAAGLKDALRLGTDAAVTRLSRENGYFDDANVRIPLPGFLGEAQTALGRIGMSGLFDDLELRLNRAAETAAPQAKNIFVSAITSLSVSEAIDIVRGPDNAATEYFKEAMTPRLTQAFRPVINDGLNESGAILTFDRITSRYNAIPLTADLGASAKGQLVDHGLNAALSGLFFYVAKEEKAIRENPAKRTTEILRRVFG